MNSESLKAHLIEVVNMNVGWQKAYSDMSERLNEMCASSKTRELELSKRIDELMTEVSVLKIQVNTYKEDFDEERKQRTELASKLADLEFCRYRTDEVDAPRRDSARRVECDSATCDSARRVESDSEEQIVKCPNCMEEVTSDELMEHIDYCG